MNDGVETAVPQVFDRGTLLARRRRALAQFLASPRSTADFLLQRSLDDMRDRLSFIERRFDSGLVVGAHLPTTGARLMIPGRVTTVETSDGLGSPHREMDEEWTAPHIGAESRDLILSPLVMQWVNDLPGALLQMRQALKPDGLLIVSMIGGATLNELRAVLLEAESDVEGGASPRVAPFCDVRDLGSLLQRAGLALPVTDSDVVHVTYPHVLGLMHDIRAMGATNVLSVRNKGPMKRATLIRAQELYAQRYAAGGGRIRATFEILTATAWAPAANQQAPLRPGSAQSRLADALGTVEVSTGRNEK